MRTAAATGTAATRIQRNARWRQGSVLASLVGLLIAVMPAEATGECRNARYRLLELPFAPSLITSSGMVAGTTTLHRAVIWQRRSGAHELTVPPGFRFTDPAAILESGDIILNALDAESRRHTAFVYSRHSFMALAGDQTLAHGAGAPSTIVGEWLPDGKTRSDAVYWRDRLPRAIGLCCGGTLKAVNQRGEMIGDAYDDQGRYQAFMWSPAGGQRLIDASDPYSSAVAINEAGHVLVRAGSVGYLDYGGNLRRLDLSPKFYSRPLAMNNCDVVVGGYGPNSDKYRAFRWSTAAGFQDLNSLIPPQSGWTLKTATAINDRGEIVGQGEFKGDDRGFLLIPEP